MRKILNVLYVLEFKDIKQIEFATVLTNQANLLIKQTLKLKNIYAATKKRMDYLIYMVFSNLLLQTDGCIFTNQMYTKKRGLLKAKT